ncbi:MAG: FAD-dependent oxidoreductase [Thermoflavifilum sp.]|uniref:flavin monoamine oxidase family protein n=1 Tax=Thermoflavifilum sp. TaxID=1968839 RepID=UPI0018A41309|nr:NAD(P)/FAD-dependent oxidoreductase [Thermoflavifilum sp.]QOR75676.1 MAG: FAD-dependent oxidoreductase [Thermoflavifilum sp.]
MKSSPAIHQPTRWDTIVVGAGAAGLQCSYELARAGQKVLVLEARDRAGGRIHTQQDPDTGWVFEAGAEFIHGRLPLTFEWVRRLGLSVTEVKGQTVSLLPTATARASRHEAWTRFHDILSRLSADQASPARDLSLQAFLDTYFSGDAYRDFRQEVLRFAMGYDAADPTRVSIRALREEWEREEGPNYRIGAFQKLESSGYSSLIAGMVHHLEQVGGQLQLSHPVNLISFPAHRPAEAQAIYRDKALTFQADRVVMTLPPGIFQQPDPPPITINPYGENIHALLRQIGYGTATKIITLWTEPWWQSHFTPDLGFILSQAPIPTWWTAHPLDIPILTGWKGGPQTLHNLSTSITQDTVIQSLVQITGLPPKNFTKKLLKCIIFDWQHDPFACGSYSYPVIGYQTLIQQLHAFFPQRLYFAGEAFHNRPPWGTVESALASGKAIAQRILET